jgi:nucleoside-triphosphatase
MIQQSCLRRHILLTGLPGCGKTTLLKRLAHEVRSLHPVGFYTEEIRHGGRRKGFRLVGLGGEMSLLADVDLHGKPRVGKYGVAVERFEDFLNVQQLDRVNSPLAFIDEIGKMECLSTRFVELVRQLLDAPTILIATIALKGGGLIDEIKQRPDVEVIKVDLGNRDRLVGILANRIRELAEG